MSGKETVKCGYLTKSPPDNKSAFYGWRKRYFILIDSIRAFPFAPRHIRIEYYQNYEDSKLGNPLGMIELNNCSGVLKREQMKSHKHVFDIVTPTRVFHLSAESTEEREEWVSLLNTNIFQYNHLGPPQNDKPKYDPHRHSTNFSQETDYNQSLLTSLGRDSNHKIRGGPRAQSLRDTKSESISPLKCQFIQEDKLVPICPDPDTHISKDLKIISGAQKPESNQVFSDNFCENEILSEQGFTSVPILEDLNSDLFSSLPIQNESPYMNVGHNSSCKSANPTSPIMPAPYKRIPVSVSMQAFPHSKFSDEPIESEYTCIDPGNIGQALEEYAKVKKH
ncbi:Son of sevenless-like protein 1-like [Oopsacas minuta]|uniref:Son of sevenless-like protein 1-like n=1 Tax=Oopsacas minuta TaxID=111878 RepID=A0AAV7JUX1_9METZ|nr:Son of sevenless-like protein 1-like [Oopsacas minuta]